MRTVIPSLSSETTMMRLPPPYAHSNRCFHPSETVRCNAAPSRPDAHTSISSSRSVAKIVAGPNTVLVAASSVRAVGGANHASVSTDFRRASSTSMRGPRVGVDDWLS